jgi:hypothetical protein
MNADGVALLLIGAAAVLLNKPFGELCRRWQVIASGRDFGLGSFRLGVVLAGSLIMLMGLIVILF